MAAGFQFSLRRAILSTTLIAIGLAAVPLSLNTPGPYLEGEYSYSPALFFSWFFAAMGGGIGCLIGRTGAGALIGVAIAVLLMLLFPPA
jgi:hypothetical protein